MIKKLNNLLYNLLKNIALETQTAWKLDSVIIMFLFDIS